MNTPTIGIIGGGQLGKMLLESGKKWGVKFNVLESASSNSICKGLAHKIIRGDLKSEKDILHLARISDILTFELEDINVDALIESGVKVYPRPQILQIIQNKFFQKKFYKDHNIPLCDFEYIDDLRKLPQLFEKFNCEKLVVKKCVGGYDGQGVQIVYKNNISSIDWNNTGEYLVEEFVPCAQEVSIIVACTDTECVAYPIVETVFNADNVLDYQMCPANIDSNLEKSARKIATQTAQLFNSPGLFAVEMFITVDGRILVNEVSPRPHNTGHHTIECAQTSQFEQLLRILLGFPLGPTHVHTPSLLVNILGTFSGDYRVNCPKELWESGHLHLYGKTPSKPGRKLGHYTLVGNNLLEKKARVAEGLHLEPVVEKIYKMPQVGIIMGSLSDYPVMKDSCEMLKKFHIPYEKHIVSAHRTPDKMWEYSRTAREKGIQVIIAGAGGAAHLPGMCASLTTIPVIGVPVKTSTLSGVDSLYSIVQMPKGVPVATVAINGASNAALLAIQILAIQDQELAARLAEYKEELANNVSDMEKELHN